MTELLAKQGPLAHIWLASNYDKRLSKAQLLKTNLVSSSELISNRPISPDTAASQSEQLQPISLRLSGQLLLGVVRIYSRQTKYLLDDIQEVLNKLKHSFKYASGASLGSAAVQVNLPPAQTSLANLNRITLQDQVTNLDLLYQEDLNLDDEPAQDISMDADRSIEVARREEEPEGFDMDLDFDLDMDTSIEQGRDAQPPMLETGSPDQSFFDIDPKAAASLELGQPLETLEEVQQRLYSPANEPQTPQPQEQPQRLRPSRRLVGRGEEGVRTTKKRVVSDSPDELERGLPVDVLRSIQHLQTHGRFSDEHLTLNLTRSQKLELINELAAPTAKRRRIWNLDVQLSDAAQALARAEQEQQQQQRTEESPLDYDLDFDLTMPSLGSDDAQTPESDDSQAVSNVETTYRVASVLRSTFLDQPTTNLDEVMKADLHHKAGDTLPLGTVAQNESQITVSERREATKCFFEMLVLATNDCVSLEQDISDHTQIGDAISIRPKDNLASKFL